MSFASRRSLYFGNNATVYYSSYSVGASVLNPIPLALGGVLLVAAFPKAYLVVAEWPGGFEWLSLVVAETEVIVGLGLLLHARGARFVAMLLFSCFVLVAMFQAVNGAQSCRCFGHISIPPWVMIVLDSVALLALALWRPSGEPVTYRFWQLSIPLALMLTVSAWVLLRSAVRPLVATETIDLGEMAKGDIEQFKWRLENRTAASIWVRRVLTSCPCLTTEALAFEVPPHEEREMIVTLNLARDPDFVGPLQIRLEARDHANALLAATWVRILVVE
jgi:hypothetical protein